VTVTKLYAVWLRGRSLYFCHSKQCNFTVLFSSAPQWWICPSVPSLRSLINIHMWRNTHKHTL